MARYQITLEDPGRYPGREELYLQGNSPAILVAWQQILSRQKQRLDALYVSLSQFNNPVLHELFADLAASGVQVHLMTRPIANFSDAPLDQLKDLPTGSIAEGSDNSPYALARPLYASLFKEAHPNYKLHIFPHLNVRHHRDHPFRQGHQAYSLDNDLFLMLYKNGGGAVGFSTANMSIGGRVEEGCFLLIEDHWSLLKTTHRFFRHLQENAIPLARFDFKKKYTDLILKTLEISQDESGFFTAAFLQESTAFAEMAITRLIQTARERLWIASPEISAYEYSVDGRFHQRMEDEEVEHYGFLRPALEMAASGVALRCLASDWNSEAAHAFLDMSQHTAGVAIRKTGGLGYSFLLADQTLLLCNQAFGPASFIYLDDVVIDKFSESPADSYAGIYAKMGQYLQIDDLEIVEQFDRLFRRKWDEGQSLP